MRNALFAKEPRDHSLANIRPALKCALLDRSGAKARALGTNPEIMAMRILKCRS